MAGVKSRIYVGDVSSRATEDDIISAFGRYGRVDRVSMKDGYAFISFLDDRDADAAVRGMDAREFFGKRLRVEFARVKTYGDNNDRGGDRGDRRGGQDNYRDSGRDGRDTRGGNNFSTRANTERTNNRIIVSGFREEISWQDLKDFGRDAGQVNYAAVKYDDKRNGVGILEYARTEDMREALRRLEGAKLRGERVHVDEETPQNAFNERAAYRDRGGEPRRENGDRAPAARERGRSRSRERGGRGEGRRDSGAASPPRQAAAEDTAERAREYQRDSPVDSGAGAAPAAEPATDASELPRGEEANHAEAAPGVVMGGTTASELVGDAPADEEREE